MILATNYKTDIDYHFNMVKVSLTFNSLKTLTLDELFSLQLLPIELNSSFIQGFNLTYCNHKEVGYRKLNIVSDDGIYDFLITCPIKFSDIDFLSLVDRGLKVKTIGEKIDYNLLKYLINKS
jgi:hypothetical protein